MCVYKCSLSASPEHMLTGPPILPAQQDGIPSFSSCGRDDASKKVEQPYGLGRGVTVSRPPLRSERETLLKGKPPVDGWAAAEQGSSSRQPLLNKHGLVC